MEFQGVRKNKDLTNLRPCSWNFSPTTAVWSSHQRQCAYSGSPEGPDHLIAGVFWAFKQPSDSPSSNTPTPLSGTELMEWLGCTSLLALILGWSECDNNPKSGRKRVQVRILCLQINYMDGWLGKRASSSLLISTTCPCGMFIKFIEGLRRNHRSEDWNPTRGQSTVNPGSVGYG